MSDDNHDDFWKGYMIGSSEDSSGGGGMFSESDHKIVGWICVIVAVLFIISWFSG